MIESKYYIIRSAKELDELRQPLYWSNADGWVDKDLATIFTEEEIVSMRWFPVHSSAELITV